MALGLVWAATALTVKRTVRKEPLDQRIGHLTTFAAFLLLFSDSVRVGAPTFQIVPPSQFSALAGMILTVSGVAFAMLGTAIAKGDLAASHSS
jgi:hypothetical protein